MSKNRDKLRQLIGFTHRNQSSIVKSIVIFTEDNQVFVTSAYHGDTNLMRLKAGVELPNHTNIETLSDYIIFRTPIIDENYNNQTNAKITAIASSQYNYATNNSKPVIIGYIAMQIDKSHLNFQQQSQFIVVFALPYLAHYLALFLQLGSLRK